jgi:DNA-binding protein HU-beta
VKEEDMAGKTDIVNSVAEKFEDITKRQAGEIVDAVFEYIGEVLKAGDRVQLPGFGTFAVSERAAREGRNPATGKKIKIEASKNVRFKAGKDLKDAVNG